MRRLFLLAVLAAGVARAEGEAPATAATDPVAVALEQARARQSRLLVDFQAPWCYSCYYMARHVTTGADWERVRREHVVLELDADAPEGARWMQEWRVKAIPTYLLFGPDGQELGRILGEQTRADFYAWLARSGGRGDTLDALKARVSDGGAESVAVAREVLAAHHARYDGAGGLAWFQGLPPPVRIAVARDAQAGLWIGRLELQRSAAEKDGAACAKAASWVLDGNLGCERPYELNKVLACSDGLPAAQRRELLRPQAELMQLLLDKRVLADVARCADERSIVVATADLYRALDEPGAEALALTRAIVDLHDRIGGDLTRDRNLSDNLRVYLERAGRHDELDALLDQLIEAFPGDYVYAYRQGKNLAGRGRHADALPYFAQAAPRAYGANRLRNAELRARSLRELGRVEEAQQVLREALEANGPGFAEDAARLRALLDELSPAGPPAGTPAESAS